MADKAEDFQAGERPSPFADRPQIVKPEPVAVTGRDEDRISGTFNSGMEALNSGQKTTADKIFQGLGRDLERSIASTYEKGGWGGVQKMLNDADKKVNGEGVGLLTDRRGDDVKVYAIRPVDPKVAEILDKANPTGDKFLKLQDNQGHTVWVETLAKAEVDLSKLNKNADKVKTFEEVGGKSVEEQGKIMAQALKDDLARYGGKGISQNLMDQFAKMTGRIQGAPALEEAINTALGNSGLSVKLDFQNKIPGIHGNTVEQTIVEVKSKGQTVARQLEQHDTMRSVGGNFRHESSGVFK